MARNSGRAFETSAAHSRSSAWVDRVRRGTRQRSERDRLSGLAVDQYSRVPTPPAYSPARVSDFVYPGATHTRLSHSIGVYHTARQIIEVIRRSCRDTFDPTRARVVQLASLLHDIGHGRFSHVFEAAARQVGLPRRHENWGAEIVLGDTEVNQVLREIDQTLPSEVAALLKEELPKDIYSTVVSSQFDADRMTGTRTNRRTLRLSRRSLKHFATRNGFGVRMYPTMRCSQNSTTH